VVHFLRNISNHVASCSCAFGALACY